MLNHSEPMPSMDLLHLPITQLMQQAASLRDEAFDQRITYSRKVFIPLTQLCRDVCHYCTFAKAPRELPSAFLTPEQVLAIAEAGVRHGCKEALFTLGDKPELRYAAARRELARLGYDSTIAYLRAMAELVVQHTGLLPHLNPGLLSAADYQQLRPVAASMGSMLESSAERLCRRGGPHFGSPDKQPAARLASLAEAGRQRVPMTTGLLIGIGETRAERLEALLALHALQAEHGHLQEIIIQNFMPKVGTKMQHVPEPPLEELLWTIAVARCVFGASLTIQTPPNLNTGRLAQLIAAGIDDWGGVSPVTRDHVNPEAPWPHLDELAALTSEAGHVLVQRLALHAPYINRRDEWLDRGLHAAVLAHCDASGLARTDTWTAGASTSTPACTSGEFEPIRHPTARVIRSGAIGTALAKAVRGEQPTAAETLALFSSRGPAMSEVLTAADELRRAVKGEVVTYVVNRNINYTNMCTYRCGFCAFARGRRNDSLRGKAYLLDFEEIARRTREAWERGATEVCLQGGIHPSFTGETYLAITRAVKAAVPEIGIHAFSPLEITHGAQTLGLSLHDFLARLRDEGLTTLPGTAAEVLDDDVRRIICPDKLDSAGWLAVLEAAHGVGLRTTSTLMFGHVETPHSWVGHLAALRALQQRTGGITEFVPLPFVHMGTPLYRDGKARPGPTFREVLLVHAVARLVLHPLIDNIQVSWPKLGAAGAAQCLQAGANDLGGTLMNESISRAAGAAFGEEFAPAQMAALIGSLGREPRQRTTGYGQPDGAAQARSWSAGELVPVSNARSVQQAALITEV